MVGLTREQVRLLNEWSKGLWVLLDQDDFGNIQKIFRNAVDRQNEYESEEMEVVFKEDIERLPEVKAIAKSVIDDIINKLTDLADHKIKPISFDQEFAINMCIDIINKTIAESEE